LGGAWFVSAGCTTRTTAEARPRATWRAWASRSSSTRSATSTRTSRPAPLPATTRCSPTPPTPVRAAAHTQHAPRVTIGSVSTVTNGHQRSPTGRWTGGAPACTLDTPACPLLLAAFLPMAMREDDERPPWPVLLLLTSRGPQGEALPLPARCPAQRPPPLPAAAAGAHRRPCDVAPGDTRTFHDQNRSSDCDSPTFLFTSSSVLIMMIGAASSSGASAPCGPAGRTSDCRMRRQVRGLIGSPCLGVCTHRDPIMCARAPCSASLATNALVEPRL
jgi:hypothetical protein